MGNMLILPGANFKAERSRGTSYEGIDLGTIYDNATVNYDNANSVTNLKIVALKTITESDFSTITPLENVSKQGSQVYADAFKCCQVSIPEGAVGISGIATVVQNTASISMAWNCMPFLFRAGENGKMVTSDYGVRWYVKSDKSIGTTDEALINENTPLNSCIKSLRILNKMEGLFLEKRFTGWLVEFTAAIHPKANSVVFNWVKPKAITTVNGTAAMRGNSTIGIGVVEPELYWIYE